MPISIGCPYQNDKGRDADGGRDHTVGAAHAHADPRTALFESSECIGLAGNNQANCIGLRTFFLRERFAAAFAASASNGQSNGTHRC
jgi:hypothetical protein